MIYFVNPPSPPFGVSNKDTMGGLGQLYPPGTTTRMPVLDLLTAAAVLERSGHPVRIVDALIQPERLGHLEEARVVFLRTSAPTLSWDLEVAREIRSRTHARIMIFGPCVWRDPAAVLRSDVIDGVLCGEPEAMVVPIVEQGHHAALWTREGAGQTNVLVEDLDGLPHPAWRLVPFERYDLADAACRRRPSLTLLSSKGCPFGCGYCPYPLTQGTRWRKRSPELVAAEALMLQQECQAGFLLFRDPEFTLDRGHTLAVCDAMIKAGCRTPWRAETRIDTLDPEQLDAMRAAGCVALNVGVESLDENVLKAVGRRPITLSKIEEAVAVSRRLGISVTLFFVVGLPEETKAGVENMVRIALDLKPSSVQFTAATPYPGTALASWAKARGASSGEDASRLSSYDALLGNENMTKEQIRVVLDFANSSWKAHGSFDFTLRNFIRRLYHRWVGLARARRALDRSFR